MDVEVPVVTIEDVHLGIAIANAVSLLNSGGRYGLVKNIKVTIGIGRVQPLFCILSVAEELALVLVGDGVVLKNLSLEVRIVAVKVYLDLLPDQRVALLVRLGLTPDAHGLARFRVLYPHVRLKKTPARGDSTVALRARAPGALLPLIVERELLALKDRPSGHDAHPVRAFNFPFIHGAVGLAAVVNEAGYAAFLPCIDVDALGQLQDVQHSLVLVVAESLVQILLSNHLSAVLYDESTLGNFLAGKKAMALMRGRFDYEGRPILLRYPVVATVSAVGTAATTLLHHCII
mmetsp:Transcript_17648/g.36630  ORF Transcript_17648/g.36630 Transcript_17648/m.36630 type:complete len:290 (-) Transcript_17648:225-1094(-)